MSATPGKKRAPLLLALLLALALPSAVAAPASSYASSTLHELRSLEQFRTAFVADQGSPRLVLLLSPT